jgi:hypothetical protein
MKARRLFLAFGAVALCAAALIATAAPDSFGILAAALTLPHVPSIDQAQIFTAITLAVLRTNHADLTTRITAKMAELVDGLPEDAVRRIEGEHDALVREAEGLQRQIAEAETAERARQAPQAPAGTVTQTPAEAVAAERTRQATIRDIGTRAAMPAADVQTALDTEVSVEAFRTRAFDAMATRQNAAPTSGIVIVRDETATRRLAMSAAIEARLARASGQRNVQIPEHARAYGEMGFAEMAAEAIGHRGHIRTPAQVIDVMGRAFHSTSDFPGIFSDALNARLLARYQSAVPTYRLFCAPYLATDFRAVPVVRAGDFPVPQRILETGAIPAGTFAESKEQLVVYPYGVTIGISRQMIVNDNLGAIDQMLGSYGDTILGWENDIAFAELISNSFTGPTLLTDSVVMFHTGHGNETASGTAISLASVGAARAQMMKQTSLNGRKLNLQPVTILTGPDRLTEAEQLTASINPALVSAAQTDWMKRLKPAGDANITSDHWYMFADPAVAPNFVYGMLQGFEGPRITIQEQFTTQGIMAKLEHDFGVNGVDFRGGTHNEGAPPT